MVELIPDMISPDIKSPAEKDLFESFKNEITDDKIVILHSLGIAEHCSNIFGEIDFVIICHEGILCLEVKGGKVSRNSGVWEFTNRYGNITQKNEGPFQQVQGNMHSLRQYLLNKLGDRDPLVRCQYACAVAIPEDNFTASGTDIIPEILFDNQFSWNLRSMIKRSFSYWRQLCLARHGFQGTELSDWEIDRLAGLLRGDFHFVPSMKVSVDRSVRELCALTDQQYEIMESLSGNPRLLISGVAGSGKTLLAAEQARRAYWEGKQVLYLCFNHNILCYLKYHFQKEQIEVETTTLHALMMKECNLNCSAELSTSFFQNDLPCLFLNLPAVRQYDLIIIDEAQDLLTSIYIKCINRLLKGGIISGNWSVFYDPNQNIFNDYKELQDVISILSSHSTSFLLTRNCRNTRQIADANTLMTSISNQGKAITSGPDVNYQPYLNKADELIKINTIIRKLRKDGFSGSDFIILSKYTLSNSSNGLGLCGLEPELGALKTDNCIWQAKKNDVRFATVSSFKGLEAKVVILIDVDGFSNEKERLLNYVAISRASALLYILYDQRAENERQNMILENFKKLGK